MGFCLESRNPTKNPLGEQCPSPESNNRSLWLDVDYGLHNYELFSCVAWGKVLQLAEMAGWIPAGTEPGYSQFVTENGEIDIPPDFEHSGSYMFNDGDIVTEKDAANLAAALESALDDIPDIDTAEKLTVIEAGDSIPETGNPGLNAVAQHLLGLGVGIDGASMTMPNTELNPFDFFSGTGKEKIRHFIAFCKKGAFEIW